MAYKTQSTYLRKKYYKLIKVLQIELRETGNLDIIKEIEYNKLLLYYTTKQWQQGKK